MSEVWIFRGTQPVLWRFPVRLTLKKRPELSGDRLKRSRMHVHFEPAVELLGCQRQALNEFFANQASIEKVNGEWRFKRAYENHARNIEMIGGVRMTGDDPEESVVWGARRPPVGDVSQESKERIAWLEDLLARGVGDSIEQLAYFWRAFRLHIAHTLMNQEQPVDFHWFKLHNCPLRTGWHELPEMDRRKPPKEPKNILRRVLGNDKMLAFDVDGEHCLRHLEVEHTPEWWQLVRTVEGRRRGKLGHENYARRYQKSLERFALAAWRLHCGWYQEMAQDGLVRVAYGPRGGFRFVWDPLARGVRRTPYKRGKAPYHATLKHLRYAIESIAPTLPGAHGRLPAVSDLRPISQAVRNAARERARSSVGKPGDGTGGGDGLLVRDDAGGVVSGETLLASRTGLDRDGMASGT